MNSESIKTSGSRHFWPWLFWYGVFNIWLGQAIGSLYLVQTRTLPASPWAWIWVFFYWNGQLAALTLLLLLALLLPLWLLSKANCHRGAAALILTPIVLVYFIDTFVYGQYRFHINGMVLDLLLHGHGQVIYFTWQSWAIVGSFFLALLFGEYVAARWIDKKVPLIKTRKWAGKLAGFYFFSLIAMNVIHIYADGTFYEPILQIDSVLPFSAPAEAQTTMAKLHLLNVAEYRKRNSMRVTDNHGFFHYPLHQVECAPPKKPLNVLWILSDALRSDMIDPKIMPNVYALSKDAVVFDNHYSNSNTTRYGIFSMFYGIPGSYFRSAMVEHRPPVMMQEFAAQNYQFGIFGSAPLTKPEFDQTVFFGIPNLRLISKASRDYNRDREITADWLKFLDRRQKSRPFYGFLFYDSTHGYGVPPHYPKPFQPVWNKDYLELNNDTDPAPIRNAYMDSANFVDSLIGQILNKMRDEHLLENTIILVSSDHGQEFNDNHLNYWGHNSNYSAAQTHVPLVLHWPGYRPEHIARRTQHFDLAPTFLQHVLGCKSRVSDYSSGSDLFGNKIIPWVLMGREYDYAISGPKDILLIEPDGNYRDVDLHYQPIEHPDMDMTKIVKALSELGRFYH